jgi:predicted amidohydrolase YtcJ
MREAEAADLVLLGGQILPAVGREPVAGGVAVRAGRVVDLGPDDVVGKWIGASTHVRALSGRLAMPGFFDSHNHLLMTGLGMQRPGLTSATSVAEVLDVVRQAASALAAGQWLQTAADWHESRLRENRFPTAQELDEVAPVNPVFMRRGGHNVVLNTAALRLLGIGNDTPNPAGGTIVRHGDGTVTGHVVGANYVAELARALPAPSEWTVREAIRLAGERYSAAGITGVIEPGLQPEEIDAYARLDAEGQLPLRVHMMWRPRPGTSLDEIRAGRLRPWRRARTSLFSIKLGVDGGVETGYHRDPYAYPDDPDYPCGKPLLDAEQLTGICRAAAAGGWHVGVHCVGDAGIDMVLDAFETTNDSTPLAGRRWSLIHMMRPRADHWERLNRLELTVTAQQPLMYALAAGFERYLGAERAQDIEPMAAYLRECHQPVGGGSDSPVAPFQPLLGISSSITRNTRERGVVGPQWAITTEQALSMYTSGSAWCAFQEDRLGTIDVGKDADIVVLSEDIVAEPDSVAGAEVLCTISGGQVVHDAV